MRPRRARLGGTRVSFTAALAAIALTAAGCGGGGDDGPSDQDYFRSVDRFCRDVSRAAARVSEESAAVAKDTRAARRERFGRIATSLQGFADATEEALDTLEDAGVPSRLRTFQDESAEGFRTYVETLRNTARRSAKDPTALTRLEAKLKAIELPDPPADVTQNAKACASFDPAGGS